MVDRKIKKVKIQGKSGCVVEVIWSKVQAIFIRVPKDSRDLWVGF
jgi:hypothetical protein